MLNGLERLASTGRKVGVVALEPLLGGRGANLYITVGTGTMTGEAIPTVRDRLGPNCAKGTRHG